MVLKEMDLEIWEEQRQFKNKGEIETNKQHLGPLCANMLLSAEMPSLQILYFMILSFV